MCIKRGYVTEGEARRVLKASKRGRKQSQFDRAHVYLCRECQKFHVGHRWS